MGRRHVPPQMRGTLPKYDREGMLTCPPNIPERWFRSKMARHETVNVLGVDYELQSVSPQWYFEQNDRCGMTGSGTRDTARYMDILFKNVAVSSPGKAIRRRHSAGHSKISSSGSCSLTATV